MRPGRLGLGRVEIAAPQLERRERSGEPADPAPIVGRQFGRAFETTLAGLKHHIETGELVDEFTQLALSAVEDA